MDIELLSLDRLPLPSLEVYAGLSFLAASCSMYYLWTESQLIYLNSLLTQGGTQVGVDDLTNNNINNSTVPLDMKYFTWHTIHWASQQPHCVWPLVNLVYCLLILLGHKIHKRVFENLRASEQENIKDQFWNLIFYKVVFVFGVVNVQEIEDIIGWCFFVSVVGFLQLARQLCKERHNYLILMNDWTRHGELRRRKILGLLSFIFFLSLSLFVAIFGWYMSSSMKRLGPNENATTAGEYAASFLISPAAPEVEDTTNNNSNNANSPPYDFNLGLHSAIFMLSEIGLLIIQTLHALTVCVFDQVFSKSYRDDSSSSKINEETYSSVAHSINFKFDLTALLFDLVHHVHQLVCCNLFLSMTSLIVSLQMRTRVRQIHAILKKRQNYIWLSQHIDQYPEAVFLEGESESDKPSCSICWDEFSTSQKGKALPCNHSFHTSCLRKWLLVSMSCPSCRLSLINEKENKKLRYSERRLYNPRPNGFWGFLQTGQTLLDLFGGWDPQLDDYYAEVPSPPGMRPVPLFADFGVQDWTVASQSNQTRRHRLRTSTTTQTPDETQKRD